MSVPPVSSAIITAESLVYAVTPQKPLHLDLHIPADIASPPLMIYLHGGSWLNGSRKNGPFWLAERGYAVASMEYRFSSEAVFPAQVFDAKGAVRWLRAHAGEFGYDATRLAVMGASAGGHLAVLLGVSGGDARLEGEVGGNVNQSSRVQAIVDFFGPTDFFLRAYDQPERTENPEGNVYRLLGHNAWANPMRTKLASGAWQVKRDAPPLLVIHGTKDEQVRLNQSQRLCEAYRALGRKYQLHLVEGGGHGGPEYDTPEIRGRVVKFLDRQLKAR